MFSAQNFTIIDTLVKNWVNIARSKVVITREDAHGVQLFIFTFHLAREIVEAFVSENYRLACARIVDRARAEKMN